VTPGSLVREHGHVKRYRVERVREDGSLDVYGPCTADGRNGPHARWRTFRADAVTVIEGEAKP
jgi:hypothetical protein